MKYDFSNQTADLVHWAPKESITTKGENPKIIKYLLFIFSLPRKHPFSTYPSIIIILVAFLVDLASIIPSNKIKELTPAYQQYVKNTFHKKRILSNIRRLENDLEEHTNYFYQAAPIYLHAYQLQRITPKDLQLTGYIVDKDSFKINALAYNLNPINNLISLLSTSKLIDFSTIRLKKLARVGDIGGDESNDISANSIVLFEISGLFKDISLEDKLDMYKLAEASGLSKKLNRVLDSKKTFDKINIK